MSVAHIGKLQENTAALCKMVAKLSGWALLEDPDMYIRRSWNALSPIRLLNSGCKTTGWNGSGSRIPDVRHPDGNGGGSRIPNVIRGEMERSIISDVIRVEWRRAAEFRMWDIRMEWRRQQNSGCDTSGWNVAAAGWNSYPGGMSYDSYPGGMSRIPYSLYSGFAYGFQRTLLNLGLIWWSKSYQNTKT